MSSCSPHENDSDPQRSGRPTSRAEGSRRTGRHDDVRADPAGASTHCTPQVLEGSDRSHQDARARAARGDPVRLRDHPPAPRADLMVVIDAGALSDLLLGWRSGERVGQLLAEYDEDMHAPHLLDIEVLDFLRRAVTMGA